MIKLGVSAAAVAAGWVLTPFVSLRRRGSLDEQRSGELRLEALLAEAERVAPRPAARPDSDVRPPRSA